MATKTNPGEFDCYAKAEPDEPMFVLLARDRHAPCLLWLWAALRELDQEQPAKVAEARKCMEDMMDWQLDHGRQPIGLAQGVLVGVMELIRASNTAIAIINDGKEIKNLPTKDDILRMCISTAQPEAKP